MDEAKKTVIHHVKLAFNQDWVGTDLVRTYEFSGNLLTLTAATANNSITRLVWERLPD